LISLGVFKELGLDLVLLLLHDILVAKLVLDLFYALDVCVSDFAKLIALAPFNDVRPPQTIEIEIEFYNVDWVHKVDERKPYPALCFQVFRKVEVVILSRKSLVYQIKHVLLTKLYWDVSDHQSCLLEDFVISVLDSV
jgi:8-oxo-dGTP pyrophosphatase MutT (NUDIX family)